jgi:flavin-dependent dehydrogenase
MMYDCIIIGAGPAGATAAYHLSKAGHAVLLLDAGQTTAL